MKTTPTEQTTNNPPKKQKILHSKDESCYTIKNLSPEQPSWTLDGYVLAKNPIKHWTNWKGNGTLFEIFVTDKHGDEIRITIFNNEIDKFYDIITPGNSFRFSNGRIRQTNPIYQLGTSSLEIQLNENSTVKPIKSNNSIFKENTNYTQIADLANVPQDTRVNVIAIIHKIGQLTETPTTHKPKRDFLLLDDSNKTILSTAWGENAKDLEDHNNNIVMIKNGKVSEFNRRKTITTGAFFLHDPATIRTKELHNWYLRHNTEDFPQLQTHMIGEVKIANKQKDQSNEN